MFNKIIKFGLVGVSGVLVGLAAITLCVEWLDINPRSAWYISTFFATLNNFLLHNYYTWRERKAVNPKDFTRKMTYFYLFSLLSLALNYLLYNLLLNPGFNYFLALSIAILVCAGLNFAVNELFIWPRKIKF